MREKCPTCNRRDHVRRWCAGYPHPTSPAPATLFCSACYAMKVEHELRAALARGISADPIAVAYWLRLEREGK